MINQSPSRPPSTPARVITQRPGPRSSRQPAPPDSSSERVSGRIPARLQTRVSTKKIQRGEPVGIAPPSAQRFVLFFFQYHVFRVQSAGTTGVSEHIADLARRLSRRPRAGSCCQHQHVAPTKPVRNATLRPSCRLFRGPSVMLNSEQPS